MLNRNEVFKVLKENEETIRGFNVRRLGLFGSAARDESLGDSDIDFVVEFETKSFDAFMNLKFFLEELFGRKVDLVLADTIKPRLRPIIMKEVVYALE